MYLEAYDGTQKEAVSAWLKARGLEYGPDDMPKLGYVAYERGEPIACAFLRNMEGTCAMFDGLCTNPDAPGDMRSYAIDLLVEKVIKEAKHLGYKGILAFTVDYSTLMRSQKFGFRVQPHVFIVSEFNQKA